MKNYSAHYMPLLTFRLLRSIDSSQRHVFFTTHVILQHTTINNKLSLDFQQSKSQSPPPSVGFRVMYVADAIHLNG